MPRGSTTPITSSPIKMLNLGDSGTGKTGALASLAKAGYRLVIMDHDNGVQILQQLLKNFPAALENVYWETFTDERVVNIAGAVTLKNPRAASNALKFLQTGKASDFDLGPATTWDTNTILVMDSLTFFSTQVFAGVLALVGRLPPAHPQIQDWGAAMDAVENTLGLLYSSAIKCHVIINTHISYIEQEEGSGIKAYPNTLGNKLPPKVGRFFNTMVLSKTSGSGPGAKREIHTSPVGSLALKTPSPATVKAKYPLESGLAELFSDLGYSSPTRA